MGQRRGAPAGQVDQHKKNGVRAGTAVAHMVRGDGTIRPSDRYPRTVRREQIGGEITGSRGRGAVVRQRMDRVSGKSEARDRGGQRRAQLLDRLAYAVGRQLRLTVRGVAAVQPVEHRPEIALQDCAL